MLAEAEAATKAAPGLAEATVQEAKAVSLEKEGLAEATVLEKKAVAEAKGIEAKAAAIEKQGLAEANVDLEKYRSEAIGITEKAEAMKQLDSVGKEHEEFKLKLDKEKHVEIAAIDAQRGIAESQAGVVGDALAVGSHRHRRWRRRVLRADHLGRQGWQGDRPIRLQQQSGDRHQGHVL